MYTCHHLLPPPFVPTTSPLTSRLGVCVFPAPQPSSLESCRTACPASSLLSLLFPSQFSIPVALAAVTCDILFPVVTEPLSPDPLCQVGFPVRARTGLRQRECGAWSVSTYLAGPRQPGAASAPSWIWPPLGPGLAPSNTHSLTGGSCSQGLRPPS